jgi:hypothetical protein
MEPEQSLHSEATLLPGYLSQTLTTEENQQVEQHLNICSTCQKELQEVKTMKAALKTTIQGFPGPSPAALSKVLNRIHQETPRVTEQVQSQGNSSWGEWIERAFRAIFEIRWAPTLASVLIVGQTILLLSVLNKPQVETPSGSITKRGIPQATTTPQLMKIKVSFVESAQEKQIRSVILKLGGQIVNGPTDTGFYTLGFSYTKNTSVESIISSLQTYPELFKSAEHVIP